MYDTNKGRILISRDVLFYKHIFPYICQPKMSSSGPAGLQPQVGNFIDDSLICGEGALPFG